MCRRINSTIIDQNNYHPYNKRFSKRKHLLFNEFALVAPATSAGSFSMRIPMLFLFNFCEEYNKVMYNCKHEITLCRDVDDRAIFKSAAHVVIPPTVDPTDIVSDGKINISLIRWYMPKIMPNLNYSEIWWC